MDSHFLPAMWPSFCKGPSLTIEALPWLCWQLHVLQTEVTRGRGPRPSVPQPASGGIEEGGSVFAFLKIQTKLSPSSQALSCHTCPPSVSCSLDEDGRYSLLFCGENFLARELPVGKAAPTVRLWTIPKQYCRSHLLCDIWIISQAQIKEQSSSWWVWSQLLSQLSASFKNLLESHHFY